MSRVRVGCSGWNYRHWRGPVYPEGVPQSRWLERYATLFDTVEVNATFYRLPTRKAAAGWVEQTPPGFLFAVKASRYLTHVRRLKEIGAGTNLFFERIAPLVEAGKLGPVLWQLPENFHRDDERLAAALGELPPAEHAFELRHESWFVPAVYEILSGHGAALVIGDHPQRPFQERVLTAGWTYVRFHQGRGRRGNYTEHQLQEWARRVAQWRRRAAVFAYFNNDQEGFAVANARRLSGSTIER